MKSLRQIISEVAQPKSEDELNFKEKHVVDAIDHPESEESQHVADDKTRRMGKRIADYDTDEGEAVYESKDFITKSLNTWKTNAKSRGLVVRPSVHPDDGEGGKYHTAKDKQGNHRGYFDSDKSYGELGESSDQWGVIKYPDTSISYVKKNGNSWEHIPDPSYGYEGSVDKSDMKYFKPIALDKIPYRLRKKIMKEEKKLDPVDKSALKKKFTDRTDKDIDNDGDVDDSDEYLHNRRKTISKAMKKEGTSEFITKAAAAKRKDKKSFEIGGDKYPVTIKDKNAEKIQEGRGSYLRSLIREKLLEGADNGPATDFKTYKDYTKNRAAQGLQVIPERLWNALKKNEDTTFMKEAPRRKKAPQLKPDSFQIQRQKDRELAHAKGVSVKTGRPLKGRKPMSSTQRSLASVRSKYESLDLEESFKTGILKLNDGSSVTIKKQDADLLNQMFKDLNPSNKKKMEKVLMTDKFGYEEILGFAREAL